ncbi:MAG: HAMP domain-containing histidine kinase [Actinobacteria bacterium]|nr:HAMP domain-containing histidine kinase [Actinomycetota bacterium]
MDASAERRPVDPAADERVERLLIWARWVGVLWALLQTFLTGQPDDAPSYLRGAALSTAGVLAAGNLLITYGLRRGWHRRPSFGLAGFALDAVIVTAFVLLFAFDVAGSQWVIVTFIPIEGAVRFQFRGALIGWVCASVVLVVLESRLAERAEVGYRIDSVTFRTGYVLLVATIVGLLTRYLVMERQRTQEALEEVTRSDAWRQQLVSTLAHDVRSPLTSIIGSAQFLSRLEEPLPRERERQLLQSIADQGQRIQQLSEDLLDLARQEQGSLRLQQAVVELRPLIERVMAYLPSEVEVQNRVPDGLMVHADPGRLEQVVYNLATNAQRHGAPPTVIEAVSRPGGVELIVTDHGTGVPSEAREGLFEPFSTGPRADSVGLGLWIVRTLAEAHGGEVTYEDSPHGGARFRVRVPARAD